MFEAGDVTQTHTIIMGQDMECEMPPNEDFFSNIALDSGIDITVTEPQATVTIYYFGEAECSECEWLFSSQHSQKSFLSPN